MTPAEARKMRRERAFNDPSQSKLKIPTSFLVGAIVTPVIGFALYFITFKTFSEMSFESILQMLSTAIPGGAAAFVMRDCVRWS